MNVSVIIPIYNGATYLGETLESVFAQTHAPYEVIAVDDGSTDASFEILQVFGDRLRIIRQANQGVAFARNTGLANASGEFICFLDQDDLWPVDRTRVLVDALAADADAQLAKGLTETLYQRSAPIAEEFRLGVFRHNFLLGSMCIRASFLRFLGPFATGLGFADDTDFWMRCREAKARVVDLEEVTLIYRLHDANTSNDKEASRFYFVGALRESLRRRRSNKDGKAYDLNRSSVLGSPETK